MPRHFRHGAGVAPDFKQALNLGIFYEDNASKKRWVLKLEDPKTLAQIDAVFVTVEPHGGSDKPSGKPLLFAYLQSQSQPPLGQASSLVRSRIGQLIKWRGFLRTTEEWLRTRLFAGEICMRFPRITVFFVSSCC